MKFRWPRYSEHPWLNRLRWVGGFVGAAVFAGFLVWSALAGRW